MLGSDRFLSFPPPDGAARLKAGTHTEAVGSGRLVQLLRRPAHTEALGLQVAPRRSKRSVFLHSGVRICPQESLPDVLASHQAYYQLRGTSTDHTGTLISPHGKTASTGPKYPRDLQECSVCSHHCLSTNIR